MIRGIVRRTRDINHTTAKSCPSSIFLRPAAYRFVSSLFSSHRYTLLMNATVYYSTTPNCETMKRNGEVDRFSDPFSYRRKSRYSSPSARQSGWQGSSAWMTRGRCRSSIISKASRATPASSQSTISSLLSACSSCNFRLQIIKLEYFVDVLWIYGTFRGAKQTSKYYSTFLPYNTHHLLWYTGGMLKPRTLAFSIISLS